MRQVLFRIPLDHDWCFGPVCVPGFGFGLLLGIWLVIGAVWFYRQRHELLKHTAQSVIFGAIWLFVAFAITQVPHWVHRSTDSTIENTQTVLRKFQPGTSQYDQAHAARDRAWRSRRSFGEAIAAYETEIKMFPDYAPAHYRLAWILAAAPEADIRDAGRARFHAEKAVSLTAAESARSLNRISALDALAAAYAEGGHFAEAVRFAKLAAEKASMAGADDGSIGRLDAVRRRIELYENETPYRDVQAGKLLPVYGYGFMMFLGFVAAGWTAVRRGRLVGVPREVIWDVCLWVLVGGIGGARLFYVVQYRDRVFEGADTPQEYLLALVNLQEGGLVLYGGIIVALTAFILFCLRRKLSPLLMTDVIMPSFFVGLAFGRLGCFMNGCCYGDRCELPWAITFPLGSVPDMALVGRGFVGPGDAFTLALHPSQLYSAGNALLLAIVAHFYFRVRPRDGSVLAFALLTYPVTRFLIEFLRGDEAGKFQTSLTISQWVSIGMFAAGLAYTFWLSRRPRHLTPIGTPAPEDSQA